LSASARGFSAEIVLAIFGPTASGKSAVAEAIAERAPAEPVSADSAQVYRGLKILTNRPSVPTHLVGIWDLDHEASVAEYQRLVHHTIDAVLEKGRTPVVVGGTGLYLRAALSSLELPPAPAKGERERWGRLYDRLGATRTHALLAERDPETAERVHPNDRRRVVRALELAETGLSLRPSQDRLWAGETRHPTLLIGLEVRRDVLVERIERRAHAMFESGVQEEVARAIAGPLSSTAAKILGLREVAELPRQEAIAALSLRTRQLAAYQRKWMRRLPGLVSVAGDRPPGEIADEILEMARRRERLPAHRGAARR
jgi:tRNA dimethylallyltransferase